MIKTGSKMIKTGLGAILGGACFSRRSYKHKIRVNAACAK